MTPVHPDILQALTAGIQSEVASYVFYTEAARKHEAAQIADVLKRLAHEEKEHFQILERQYDSLVRSEKWITTADVLKQEGLPEIGEEMTAEHQELIDEVKQTQSIEEILDIAYRLEEEAHDLFAREENRTKSAEARKIFGELAKFEQGHMDLVEQMRKEYQ